MITAVGSSGGSLLDRLAGLSEPERIKVILKLVLAELAAVVGSEKSRALGRTHRGVGWGSIGSSPRICENASRKLLICRYRPRFSLTIRRPPHSLVTCTLNFRDTNGRR